MVFFISPPFGNYISLPNMKSITGSYTLDKREGLLMQIIKTFRYSFEYGGWINKIGLRNPGIDYAIKNYNKNDITSVAILKKEEIPKLLKKIPEDMDIEINISCPNTDEAPISDGIKQFLNPKRKWCILKLSPLIKMAEIESHYKNGFRQFHCSNTLPIENRGGLSGSALIPYTSNSIKKIKEKYPDTIIIAGGGVRDVETAELYRRNGADHISISTLCLNPILFGYLYFKI
jgi:dihydroorotate dehydrogenase